MNGRDLTVTGDARAVKELWELLVDFPSAIPLLWPAEATRQ